MGEEKLIGLALLNIHRDIDLRTKKKYFTLNKKLR